MRLHILILLGFLSLATNRLEAQLSVSLMVEGALIETDCTDFFSAPDPMYSVQVAGEAVVFYDTIGGPCYNLAPHVPYTAFYDGSCNLPTVVEVCFEVFENDGIIIPCLVVPDCRESMCMNLPIPAAGTSRLDTLRIPTGSSRGELYLRLETLEDPNDFNYICGAVDLGMLGFGAFLGDTLRVYNNSCADALNEINPVDIGVDLFNNQGVWFRYMTGPTVSPMQIIGIFSDPLMGGDIIDAELMVFAADSCTGALQRFPLYVRNQAGNNAEMRLYCPLPNTTYYILVDGAGGVNTQQGDFSLVIVDPGLPFGGDLRCEADALGAVPEGGSVSSPTPVGNFCAGFSDDPFVRNFISRNSVWFSFIAPASGHVQVSAFSLPFGPIDLELALYSSSNDSCTGNFLHLYSGRDPSSFDESFTLSCLDPGRPYWILVDGSGQSSQGYFSISVTDLGDIRPVIDQAFTICSEESIQVGPITHTSTGYYIDTLKIPGTNCDSIVRTDLTVLPSLLLGLVQTRPAIGTLGADGQARATISGGSGDYSISWCGGPFIPLGTATSSDFNSLQAGTNCCVVLRDGNACQTDTCFLVDFVPPLAVSARVETSVLCHGDSSGALVFSALGGRGPYVYNWSDTDQSLGAIGVLLAEGDSILVGNLPAGAYRIIIADQFFTDTLVLNITQPDPLVLDLEASQLISCFQACDGGFTLQASGGVGGYQIDTLPPLAAYGCAGTYRFVLRDANGCQTEAFGTLYEPQEFLIFAEAEAVTCFDGDDGSISISSNGSPIAYEWSHGPTTATVSGLAAATYQVTVTNADGCIASLSQTIDQPASPLEVRINELQPISCAANEDGILQALPMGGGGGLVYRWSDGQTSATATDLAPAIYTLSVTDARGCEAVATYTLTAPPILTATASVRDLRCPDPEDAGQIRVESVRGGLPPYLFSLGESGTFTADSLFTGLRAGAYNLLVEDALGCVFSLPMQVAAPPVLLADLGTDRTVLLGDSVLLQLNTNSQDLVYTWSFDPTLQSSAIFYRPQRNELINLRILDTLTDCTASASLQLLVDRKPRYYVPTAFSPNGDGVNDRFFPFGGSDVLSIEGFRIFDRFGSQVFALEDSFRPNVPNLGWDGRVRGQDAAIGLYVYTARIRFYDGREEIAKGEVMLLR